MIDKDRFNILKWDYKMVTGSTHWPDYEPGMFGDKLPVEIFVDVDYKDAHHRVSFYCTIEDESRIEEEVDEFMICLIEAGYHNELFYGQLKNSNIPTLIQ